MRTTIDSAGRLVVPKVLRDRLGLRPGEVDVEIDGADLRVRPVTVDRIEEQDGWLVIPSSGQVLSDDDVQTLRDADQR